MGCIPPLFGVAAVNGDVSGILVSGIA